MRAISKYLLSLCIIVCLSSYAYAGVQAPWETNQNGTLYPSTLSWNYTMGYSFTPQKDGKITQLGGFFTGEKLVRVWNKLSGEELTSVYLTGQFGQWRHVEIFPVDVYAGMTYLVGVYLGGSGGAYQYSVQPFPQTYGDIVINSSCYVPGNGRPQYCTTTRMYGQVDIGFTPADEFGFVQTDLTIIRTIAPLEDGMVKVTLDVHAPTIEMDSFGIVEEFPEGSRVSNISHEGVIRGDKIEWLLSDFTRQNVSDVAITYIINQEALSGLSGYWLSVEPPSGGDIEEESDE